MRFLATNLCPKYKHICLSSLLALLLLFTANNAFAHDGCKDLDHVDHMGYARTQNWLSSPQSVATGPVEDYIYGPTDFLNCTCVGPVAINYTHQRSRTHQVNVGGEASVTAKSGLATKLIADAHANITLNGGWEGTWLDQITVNVGPYDLPAWTHVTFEHVRTQKYVASGTVHSADCHFTCTRGLLSDCDDFCNQVTSSGSATGWTTAERVRFYNAITCPEKP